MFEKLLGREPNTATTTKKNGPNNTQRYAPKTKIAYKPNLVSNLQKENQELVSLYMDAMTAAQNRKSELVKELLTEFKDSFVDHLLKENTSLYIYLRQSAKRSSSQDAIKSVKGEMDQIGRKVRKFLDHSIDEQTIIDAKFVLDMQDIGAVLMKRIEQEETFVYPHYRPSSQID